MEQSENKQPLGMCLSLPKTMMMFKAPWLLLHLLLPNLTQISLVVNPYLEPHKQGNTGKYHLFPAEINPIQNYPRTLSLPTFQGESGFVNI